MGVTCKDSALRDSDCRGCCCCCQRIALPTSCLPNHWSAGVLTKLDIMDRGTDAVAVLKNEAVPLALGFVGVVLRRCDGPACMRGDWTACLIDAALGGFNAA